MAAVDQHRQHVPQSADLLPGFGKQRLQYRILLAGFASPKYGDRHQLHIEAGIGESRPHHRHEHWRGADARIRHQATAFVMRKKEERSRRAEGLVPHRVQGAWQAQLPALVIEHQQIGKVSLVEDVANRQIALQVERFGGFRKHPRPRPQIKHPAQDVQRPSGEIQERQSAHVRPDARPGDRCDSTQLLRGIEAIDAGN